MEFLVVSSLNGIIYGLLLFMISAGLTLVFGMMGVVNFAHASFFMMGAYLSYSFGRFMPFWMVMTVVPLVVAATGILVERYLLRHVHKHGHMHEILLTFGLAFIIEEFVKMLFGNFAVGYHPPESLQFAAFNIFGSNYPFYRIFIGIVAVAMFAALYALLRFTRTGIVVRAAVHKPDMVEALGHDVPRVFMLVFGIGVYLGAMAGVVGAPILTTSPNMAAEMGVTVFVIVVVGGLGSLEGALLASLMIGLFSSFSVGLNLSLAGLFGLFGLGDWARSIGGLMTLQLSTVAASVPIFIMLIVLLFRPAGLMGEQE